MKNVLMVMLGAAALVLTSGIAGAAYDDFACAGNDADMVSITSASDDDFGPEQTCNGEGLDAPDGSHSTDYTLALQMPSQAASPNGGEDAYWVLYQMDEPHPIINIHIWNHNEECCTTRGIQTLQVDVSDDGSSWTSVGEFTLAEAPGEEPYLGEDIEVEFTATYILLTSVENFGDGFSHSFGEVRFDVGESGPNLSLNVVGSTYAEEGGDITLSANDDMLAPYQWQKDGGDIGGETNATLALSPTVIADTGSYALVSEDGVAGKAAFTSNAVGISIFAAGSLPVSGLIGLGLLAMTSALGGVVALRKQKK